MKSSQIVLPVTVSGSLDTSGVPKPFHDFLPKLERDDLHVKDGDLFVRRAIYVFINQFYLFISEYVDADSFSVILYLIDTQIVKNLLTPCAGF